MTSNTKTTTSKKKTTAVNKTNLANTADRPSKMVLEKSDFIVIPAGLLVITCLYVFVMFLSNSQTEILTNPLYGAFWFPPLPSLLLALFGGLYIYKVLRKNPVRKLAKAIMYMLFVILVIFLLFAATVVGGKGHLCTGLFGVQADCSQTNAFLLYVLFANAYTLMALSVLAIVGGVALLVSRKK